MVTMLIGILAGGMFGYFFGNIRFFREEKHRAYRELLPIILKCGYLPESRDQEEFNKALTKLWLYGNKEVAEKMDNAISIIIEPQRGNMTKAFQDAVVAMRKDLRMGWLGCWWDRLEPKDVLHIYTDFSNRNK